MPAPAELPTEYLQQSASLASRIAAERCPNSGADCAWYHATWPLWRLLGVGSGPAIHNAFFRNAIASLPHQPRARVLISGSADQGMLMVALDAFRRAGIEPDFTVLDRCDTPLALCRVHAERLDLAIHTVAKDIRDFEPDVPFDIACTHAFVGYFAPSERPDLARAWQRQLRPGGHLLTVNRLRPDALPEPIGFTTAQVEAFVATILDRAPALLPNQDLDLLESLARTYAARIAFHPVHTEQDLSGPLCEAGFEVDIRTELLPPRPGGPTGPTVPGNALYALIVATSRG
ncbi:MAG: class I SAM-dependent methyltransferase [Deltaproteobacteria bacterium]|nr:class I SAM-dependent methyltransferase [Deltaproteobacteria bacterium]MBW2254589.1 class I SAM-dependent methyltransferase [Deltaproteobacteria bacterium]